MNQPMFLLANLAVGGHWPGAPDAATRFPARFAIQFIRAYRFD
jgi:beta-glucanase (GH16 family)